MNPQMTAGSHGVWYDALGSAVGTGQQSMSRWTAAWTGREDTAKVVTEAEREGIQGIAKKGFYGSFLMDDLDLVYRCPPPRNAPPTWLCSLAHDLCLLPSSRSRVSSPSSSRPPRTRAFLSLLPARLPPSPCSLSSPVFRAGSSTRHTKAAGSPSPPKFAFSQTRCLPTPPLRHPAAP